MDRNQDEIIKQVKREEQQAFISKFVKDVNSTVADDFKAIFLIPEAEEKGVLFSRYGKGRDTSESMSHLVQSEDYIIADPAVIDGTKSAEQGTYYMYSKFFDQNQRSPSHKAEKITFNQMLDFVNDGYNPIAKPAKPKLGFWGTIRNALSGLFGKPEGQKKYEREMEVYRAKKCSILESDFKFKVPDYNKKLLDPIAAAEYTEKGNLLSDEELKAKWEIAKAANNMNAAQRTAIKTAIKTEDMALKATKANLAYFQKSPNLEVGKGAKIISDIIDGKDPDVKADDPQVKEANKVIKGFLLTYGKDIYKGETNTEVSKFCSKYFGKICEEMWNAKEQVKLDFDDGSEAKNAYLYCANKCAERIDLKNLHIEADKLNLDRSKDIEKANELLENVEKAKNQPIEEKKSGFKEWETKLIEENTNTYFMRHTDKEIKYGAQLIQRYLDEGAANFTTKENEAKGIGVSEGWNAVKDFLKKGNDYLTKEDLRDSETSKKFIENYGNFCKEVGKLMTEKDFHNYELHNIGIKQGVKLHTTNSHGEHSSDIWGKIDKLAKNTFTPEKVNEIFTPKQPEAEKQGFVIGN